MSLTDEQISQLEHTVRCGAGADRILNDEYVAAALKALEVDTLREMDRTQYGDTEIREACYFRRDAILSLRTKLSIQRTNGQLAEQKLKDNGAT